LIADLGDDRCNRVSIERLIARFQSKLIFPRLCKDFYTIILSFEKSHANGSLISSLTQYLEISRKENMSPEISYMPMQKWCLVYGQ
jgi:hypothetical protein